MKKDPVFYDSQCSYYRFVNFAVSVLILIAKQPAPFFTLNFTAVTHYSTIFQIFKYIVSNRLRTLSINQSIKIATLMHSVLHHQSPSYL